MQLVDKIALITGAGQGIGRGIAEVFGREGATVIVVDKDPEAIDDTLATLAARGQTSHGLLADISDEGAVQSLADTVSQRFGRLDILVNNAGVGAEGTLATRTMEAWDRVISINLRAPYMLTKYLAPLLSASRPSGAVVNIASTRALMSEANTEPYSASKGGLLALTHSLAVSLGPAMRVNAISPGWIETSDWQKPSARRTPVHRPIDLSQHPVGRVGTPLDIAETCLFLCSDQAGFITGQNFVVDGGMTIKMIYEE